MYELLIIIIYTNEHYFNVKVKNVIFYFLDVFPSETKCYITAEISKEFHCGFPIYLDSLKN